MHDSLTNYTWLLDITDKSDYKSAINNLRKTSKENRGRTCKHCGWTHGSDIKMPKWKTLDGLNKFHLSPTCSLKLEEFIEKINNNEYPNYDQNSSPDYSSYDGSVYSDVEIDPYNDNTDIEYDGSITPTYPERSCSPTSSIFSDNGDAYTPTPTPPPPSPSPSPIPIIVVSDEDENQDENQDESEYEGKYDDIDQMLGGELFSDDDNDDNDDDYKPCNMTVNNNYYQYKWTTYMMMGLMIANVAVLNMLCEKDVMIYLNHTL
jgi:hypothetical protein